MSFSFERPNLRLYKYYFFGLANPITISAYNSKEARAAMDRIWSKLPPPYQKSRIIGETVSLPVFGVTERTEGNRTFIWVGKEYSTSGWMDKDEYKKRFES
jgi:predicted GTPase